MSTPNNDNANKEDARRDELREKIEAAEARNEERSLADYAREAQETATGFVKDHPLTTIFGVAALGLIIGALTPPGRRMVSRAGHRASGLAAMAAELGIAYGTGMLDAAGDAARTGQDHLEDLGDDIGRKARGFRRGAGLTAANTGDDIRTLTRRASRKTGRTIRDLKARAR
ncbi:MAG: hypothetical protein ABJM58_04865 [Alteripontixanthobacter sp.]